MKPSILVIDDDHDFCDYIGLILGKEGLNVRGVSNPKNALKEIKKGEYHVVLLDLMMPGMNGMEVLKQIRKIDDDIDVIIFTGYPSIDSAIESVKLKVSDYLKKPITDVELLNSVQKILRNKGLLVNKIDLVHQTIGSNIRNVRTTKCLTLKQLAKRTGLSVSLLSQIERAESSASILSLYKITLALSIPLKELFGDY